MNIDPHHSSPPSAMKRRRRRRRRRRRDKTFGEREREPEDYFNPQEWKSLFPVSAVFKSPQLLLLDLDPPSKPVPPILVLGPLYFNPIPIPTSRPSLFSSPSLFPHFPPFHPPRTHYDPSNFVHNRLESLHSPGTNNSILFFPTGPNSDRLGFLLLSVDGNSHLVVEGNNGDAFTADPSLSHQILRLSVNPVAHLGSGSSSSTDIGYLLASTMYSVHWFVVKSGVSDSNVPSLVYVGSKVFKACPVARACWSPHVPEESVVLLENGGLFLFDLELWPRGDEDDSDDDEDTFLNRKGTRLKVSWDECSDSREVKWVACEFSWHPRILVIARSDAVFVVDFRPGQSNCVSCLMMIETLNMYTLSEKEKFISMAKAGPDGFRFALVSDTLLVLCDVRNLLMPILQWAHGFDNPSYVNVFRLADMRSNSKTDMYNKASESGNCIVLGSFWDSEFNLFCYGPALKAQTGKLLADSRKYCSAWERSSKLLLSGNECHCGSCLMKEEISKDSLPEGMEWQRKKRIVLGFSMINKDISSLLSKPDEFGGFTLVKLMSSGELESQRYSATWEIAKKIEHSHNTSSKFNDHLRRHESDRKYKLGRKFTYVELDYLKSYLDHDLEKLLSSKLRDRSDVPEVEESFLLEIHGTLCEKLSVSGLGLGRKSTVISVTLNGIRVPSSFHEVALTRMWVGLPIRLLQMGFSCNPKLFEVVVDNNKALLEFMGVPDVPQLPPFHLRNPVEEVCTGALVGPVLPLPVLHALHGFHSVSPTSNHVSFDAEYRIRCNEVVKIVSSESRDDHTISLGSAEEAWDSSQTAKPFGLHKPVAFGCSPESEVFDTMISRVVEKDKNKTCVGVEMFDSLCPIQLEFGDSLGTEFGAKELKVFKLLKRQFSKWQRRSQSYQQFCSEFHT